MKQEDLSLARHTGHRPERMYDGKVITLASDMGYCADTMTLKTLNDETVEVSFSLDCHDREVPAWAATPHPTTSEYIRTLMIKNRRGAAW